MPRLEARLQKLLSAGPFPDGEVHEPATARRHLDRAYELAFADDARSAAHAAEQGLSAAGNDSELRIRILGVLTAIHANNGAEEHALEMLNLRLSELRASGRAAQADVESRLGLLLFRQAAAGELPRLAAELSRAEEERAPAVVIADLCLAVAVLHEESGRPHSALPLLRAAVEHYRDDGHTDGISGSLMYLAHCLAAEGQASDALDAANELLAMDINRALRSSTLLLRARLRADVSGAGERKEKEKEKEEEAAADAAAALELYLDAGIRIGAIASCSLLAQLLIGLGRFTEAAMALRLGVEQAELAEHPSLSVLKMNLGNVLMDAEDYGAAAEVLAEADRLQERCGVPDHDRAGLLASLGHARRHSGEHAAALTAWRTAHRIFSRAGQHVEASRVLLAMGSLLSQNHRTAEALQAYAAAAEEARLETQDPAPLADALHALGYALCEAKDATGLLRVREAIALTRESGASWFEADFTDTLARSLWLFRRGEETVAAALSAADLFASAGDEAGAGNAELFAARVLAERERPEDAVAIYNSALGHAAAHTVLAIGAYRGLAEVLAVLGRREESMAATVEADRLTGMPAERTEDRTEERPDVES